MRELVRDDSGQRIFRIEFAKQFSVDANDAVRVRRCAKIIARRYDECEIRFGSSPAGKQSVRN